MTAMADYLLQMNGIVKSFGGVNALNGIDIKVRPGECVGLCGENGAGKSTLMKVLSAVYPYGTWEGEILWDGQPLKAQSISETEAAGIVIIHQELTLVPDLSVAENIFMGHELTLPGGRMNYPAMLHRAEALMRELKVPDMNVALPVSQYGGGYQQLVEIAKALNKQARLFIQGLGDFYQLLVTAAVLRHRQRHVHVRHLELAHQGFGTVEHRRVVHAPTRQGQFVAHEDVFGHRQVRHQGQFLVDDDDAGRLGFADGLGLQRLAVPKDFALPGAIRVDRRQHLHQGGFTGTVLAAQADAFARSYLDVDAVERVDTAKAFDDAVHLQQVVGHGGHCPASCSLV